MKISKKQIKEYAGLLFAFLLVFAVMYFVTGCPIKFFTGVSCAGCGMTRAYFCLLHLDFKGAFYCHPLFCLPPLFIIIFLAEKKGLPKKYSKAIYGVMATVFIIVYIYRMISPDNDIVVFEPQNGLIFKTINHIIEIIK